MHKDDPLAIDNPYRFEEFWFGKGPDEFIYDSIISFWHVLEEFLAMRLVHEGNAWKDKYGKWLVHEGETMDQAKARVDDRERQRLKEEAIEKYNARSEQHIRENEKQIAVSKANAKCLFIYK